ncbi:biotin/lipoyl-binding protein [Clostridium sediminicola]|uniref:biotin/lipoyl-containing protein n=1 Tax=Clostridium sediminicola TaxID=3114879 RepID=UPI0031F24B40
MKKYKINLNDKIYEVEVEEMDASSVSKSEAVATKEEPKQVQPSSSEAEEVLAPLPGNVLDIKVSQGKSVKAGDVLLILEAMKLENEVVAHKNGIIESILATKGAAVVTGDCLVTIK